MIAIKTAAVFDFDGVLLDVEAFNQMRVRRMEKLDIAEDVFFATKKKSSNPLYCPMEHAQRLARHLTRGHDANFEVLAGRIRQELYQLTILAHLYRFKDASEVLFHVRDTRNCDPYVLTQGNWFYQNLKIKGAKLGQLIHPNNVLIAEKAKGPFVAYLAALYDRIIYYEDTFDQLKSVSYYLRRHGLRDFPIHYALVNRDPAAKHGFVKADSDLKAPLLRAKVMRIEDFEDMRARLEVV